MERVSTAEFLRAPMGSCALAGPSLAFCASPELCGVVMWGAPQPGDIRALAALVDVYRRPGLMAPRFDAVLDGSGIERVDADTLAAVVSWLAEHRAALLARVRLQASVAPRGLSGYVLTGILPLSGGGHPFRMFRSLHEALVEVGGSTDEALAQKLTAIALEAQGVDPALNRLRDLLRERRGDIDIHAAAGQLAMSSRTLQRVLASAGTSFKDEQIDARFALACEMLVQSDAKIADVADRVSVSERTLNALFRTKRGCTPAEYRKRGGDVERK